MLAYRKWVLSLGIAAVTPGIALAGPFPFSKSDQSVPQSAAPDNQKLAEEAASNLRAAKFSGFDIELEVQNGVCLLKGKIASQAQKDQATQVISTGTATHPVAKTPPPERPTSSEYRTGPAALAPMAARSRKAGSSSPARCLPSAGTCLR